jgi:cell division transport system permease protein
MKHLLYLHGRAARQALRTLLRQPLGSLLSLFMLAVAISLPLGLYLTVASLASWSNGLAASPQITLFMELNADRADVETVNQTLKQHALVHSHRFVSKESALKDLMARNGLAEVTDGLAGNPLPDAFIVSPKDTEPEALERLQKELSGLPMVETSQFDAGWARKLHSLLTLGHQLTILLGAALGIALVLASSNTIRLQILARLNEIEVSKLIGATDGFIRRPFMYFAVFQGMLAARVAWLL